MDHPCIYPSCEAEIGRGPFSLLTDSDLEGYLPLDRKTATAWTTIRILAHRPYTNAGVAAAVWALTAKR